MRTRSDATRGGCLLVREVVRDAPDEARLRLDILGKAPLAFPLSSVNESGDAVSDADVVDARPDFFDFSSKVATQPTARRREKVAVLPIGRVQCDGRGLPFDGAGQRLGSVLDECRKVDAP